jgi:putative glutamine amidotransferase
MSHPHQPLIGITSGLTTNKAGSIICQVGQDYINAIQNANGIPLVIPVGAVASFPDTLLSDVDGVVFTGGADIDPERFNGKPHPKVYGISPERDEMEFILLARALEANKPILAICRGIQVLNVALGGSLYTHIQDQLETAMKHDWYPGFPRDKLAHPVNLTKGGKLHAIYEKDRIEVNSLHHQGIANIGKGLQATAFAPDGLIEGLEVEGADFALGVQWHPECLPYDPGTQKLFHAFITASGR